MTLRETIANLMVRIHLVRPELAREWAEKMDDAELRRRFRMYSRILGKELSAADPKPSAGNVPSTRLLTSRDDDGRSAAFNPVPERGTGNARFGGRATGSEGRGDFCPGSVPDSENKATGNLCVGTSVAGEGFCF